MSSLPQAASHYAGMFRNGATIWPHVLTAMDRRWPSDRPGWTTVLTTKSKQAPSHTVPPETGDVPDRWIRHVYRAAHLLPFALRPPDPYIVPDFLWTEDAAIDVPFWLEMEELYESRRGQGKTPKTLLENIDYLGKLSRQPLRSAKGHMVIHPSAGDHMRGARCRLGAAICDNTIYWTAVPSRDEAGYLVALLNAPCLDRAFAQARDSGRHFHLHPWRKVPIPAYDEADSRHVRLAQLCTSAESLAQATLDRALATSPELQQVGLTARIREALEADTMGREPDAIVAELLPDQALAAST